MIGHLLPEGVKVTGESYEVRLPSYVEVARDNQKPVNLNVYRNLHHHHLNRQKTNFHDAVKPLLRQLPRAEKIWIHYTIFAPRNGRLDTMNVGSVVDKYFSDTLVEAGKIPDDDYDHVVLVTFSFGGVVPLDGHVTATIHILEEETPMRMILDQDDIQSILDAHAKTLSLPNVTGVDLTVDDDGNVEAEILFDGAVAKPKNKGGRPRGSRNKPKASTSASKPKATETKANADDDSEAGGDGTAGRGDQAPEDGAEVESGKAKAGKAETKAEKPVEAPTSADETFGEEDGPPLDPTPKSTGGGKGKNLFEDEEDRSSDSQSGTKSEADSSEEEAPAPKSVKKSSIFDAD